MLTKRQEEILNIIIKYIEDEGMAPTVREIGEIASIASTSTVFGFLHRLEKKGYINIRKEIPRGITVNEGTYIKSDFGDRVRLLRENIKMTQVELGQRLGISDRVLGYYELNDRFPRKAEVLIKMAEIFNVTVDYLVRGEVDTNEKILPQYGNIMNLEALECASILENLFSGKVLTNGEKDEIFRVVSVLYFQGKEKNLS